MGILTKTGSSLQWKDIEMIPLSPDSKPQFSGHETFPLRQLWLNKAYRASVDSSSEGGTIFNDEAIVKFGVGKNMVSSIRYWATACKILEDQTPYLPTQLGHQLFGDNGLDQYCESPATAWLMHWFMASTYDKTTTWYYVFNHVTSQVFDRETVVKSLISELDELAQETATLKRISPATIKRDVECCIRSYVPHIGGDSAEDTSEPLLGELGLIQQHNKNTFEFRRGAKRSLPDGIFAYALLDYWKRQQTSSVMAFDKIAHDYGSPGRVFKLDEDAVADRLMALDELTNGEIQWTEQAGIRQVTRRGAALSEVRTTMLNVLRAAYGK